VESIRFERSPTLAGRFVGQPNVDVTGPHTAANKEGSNAAADRQAAAANNPSAPPPGTIAPEKLPRVEPAKNGIRDLQITLTGLREAALKQVTVRGQTDKGQVSWRLDTSDSTDAPLVVRRSGYDPTANLFLEPPPGDCFRKELTVNITYADGQNANVAVKVGERHTDPELVFDLSAAASMLDARVFLVGDDQVQGRFEGISDDALHLVTPWQDKLDIPLTTVVGAHLALPERKETPESFAKRLETRGSDDLLLAQNKDGEVIAIPGIVEGTEGDRLRFRYQDKARTVPLKNVEGLVLAARPEPKRPDATLARFALTGGQVLSGRWLDLDASTWTIETAWGQALRLPSGDFLSARFRASLMMYLSDMGTGRVEEAGYFGRPFSWRRDVNLLGEPLRMAGETYEHGLAVHSRCVLTYDLGGRFATFRTIVGFDETAGGEGRVDCRVFVDDKEVYSNPDLRADAAPVPIDVPVAGAQRLSLSVDFGKDQDSGDRVIWADARLYRRSPPAPTRPTAGQAATPPGNGG
jgi:hypothetical protein